LSEGTEYVLGLIGVIVLGAAAAVGLFYVIDWIVR
jgi:hypothetical protein